MLLKLFNVNNMLLEFGTFSIFKHIAVLFIMTKMCKIVVAYHNAILRGQFKLVRCSMIGSEGEVSAMVRRESVRST